MPTAVATRPSGSPPRFRSRIELPHRGEPLAARARTGSGSPAVSRFARYSIGIRSSSIAGKTSSGSASEPGPSTRLITGESGGTYQTIGSVRYSGWSGQRDAVLDSERVDRRAAGRVEPVLGDPVAARLLPHVGVVAGRGRARAAPAAGPSRQATEAASCDPVGVVEDDAEVADLARRTSRSRSSAGPASIRG